MLLVLGEMARQIIRFATPDTDPITAPSGPLEEAIMLP
jgi:hypothetical protein